MASRVVPTIPLSLYEGMQAEFFQLQREYCTLVKAHVQLLGVQGGQVVMPTTQFEPSPGSGWMEQLESAQADMYDTEQGAKPIMQRLRLNEEEEDAQHKYALGLITETQLKEVLAQVQFDNVDVSIQP